MTSRQAEVDSWIRPRVRVLQPYESARDAVQSGLMLDANENPFPHTYSGIDINRDPDPNQLELRGALAAYVGLKAENVLVGSGSDEVLDWIFKVFCESDIDRVAIAEPTHGMYTVMADICRDASKVCRSLSSQRIVVRDRSAVPGLQDCIRVTIGAPDENARFLRHLKECLEGGST